MDYKNLIYTLEEKENGYYACSRGRYFRINEKTFHVLKSFSEGTSVDELAADYRIEKDEIEKILFLLDSEQLKQGNVSKLLTFIPSAVNNIMGKFLSFTGNIKCLAATVLIFVLFTIYYLFEHDFRFIYADMGFVDYLVAVFVVVLIHEYGHITMAYKLGLKDLNIYVGFYLIFPILYSKISELVTFKFKNRLIVDFGGIYFQMITLVISYLFYFFYGHEFVQLFIMVNMFIMLINIIPFSFTDGYWLYSDLFQIENLNSKATKFIGNVINLKFNEKQPFSIMFYAVFRNLVFAVIMIYVVCFLLKQLQYIDDTFYGLKESNWSIFSIFRCFMLLLPFVLFTIYLIRKIHYGITKYYKRIS
jgi:putative peptide zinc metalloprotease protein